MSGGGRPSILGALAAKFKRGGARRQIFICGGPDCCTREQGIAGYEALKREIQRAGLEDVRCTRTGCMGVCGNGPIAMVHPCGVWYEALTPDRAARVVSEHLAEGRVVEAYAFSPPPDARAPLG